MLGVFDMPDKKKIPLGKPLQLSDDDLDELSKVTEETIEKTEKFWRKHAPEPYKDLLDAVEVEEENNG